MEEQTPYRGTVGERGTCETCRWWEARPRTPGEGDCHRYPPRPGKVLAVVYPPTDVNDWCGEHTPKEDTDAGRQRMVGQ